MFFKLGGMLYWFFRVDIGWEWFRLEFFLMRLLFVGFVWIFLDDLFMLVEYYVKWEYLLDILKIDLVVFMLGKNGWYE